MKTWSIRALLVAGTIGAVGLAGVGTASATTSEEACFTAAINSARATAGLSALTTNGDLVSIAESWSQQLANAGALSHNPSLTTLAPSVWMSLGENVGEGPTCDSIATAFYNSPEHRANILDVNYSQVGVGVVDAPDGTIWVTEDFMGTANPVATSPAPAPVVVHTTAPAPVVVHTTAPVPAPVHSEVPVVAHTTAPAPAPAATQSPATPAVQPTQAPTPAVPLVDPVFQLPASPPAFVVESATSAHVNAGASARSTHRIHNTSLIQGAVSAVGAFFSHLF